MVWVGVAVGIRVGVTVLGLGLGLGSSHLQPLIRTAATVVRKPAIVCFTSGVVGKSKG